VKKIIKEGLKLAILLLIVTNVISYFRTKDINAKDNLEIILNATTINGKSVKDIIKKDKPLIINFWGTWCPICAQEVSTLSKLAKRGDFTLITVASKSGSGQDIKSYMQKKGVNFIVINDSNGDIANKFKISVFPTTLFYSSNRKSIIKDSGYTTYAGFLARVKGVNITK